MALMPDADLLTTYAAAANGTHSSKVAVKAMQCALSCSLVGDGTWQHHGKQ